MAQNDAFLEYYKSLCYTSLIRGNVLTNTRRVKGENGGK